MNGKANIIRDGAIAGLLGAGVVALWFLIFDFSRGVPFETPNLLASVLFHGRTVHAIFPQLVIEYTAVHFLAFVIFGIVGAVLVEAAERERSLILALLILLAAFEGLFLALVVFMGPVLESSIAWWTVLVANLLATFVMLLYFSLLHPKLVGEVFGPWTSCAAEGIIAGLIGATVVAFWFVLADLGTDPFRTPAMLGAVLLQGITNPASIQITAPLVIGYTVVHYAAFCVFGVLAACLAAASEREPVLLLGFLVLFACFEVFFLGFAAILSHSLLDQLGWSTVVVGNLLASTAMLAFFYLRHRELHVKLAEHWANQT